MTAPTSMGVVDPISIEDIVSLAAVTERPCVSLLLPTHRSGPETVQSPKRLRALADRAEAMGAPSDVLGPVRTLVEDAAFWQHQADGLAVYCAPGQFRVFRLEEAPPEEVHVSETFRVRPLVPLVSDGTEFRLLALSQNAVRLFQGSRYEIEELVLDGVPTSLEEALAYEEDNPRMHRAAGTEGQFHGHGGAEELPKAEVERYFRAVDHGLRERFGVSELPLVLASVGYYQPMFASVSSAHPHVVEHVVEGNPEHRSAAELHQDAWRVVTDHVSGDGADAWSRFRDVAGTGLTGTDLSGVVLAACHGRVDTLFVAPGGPVPGRVDVEAPAVHVAAAGQTSAEHPEDLVDRAVLETVRHSGSVVAMEPDRVPGTSQIAALYRY